MLKVTRFQLLRYGVAVLVTALALLLTVLLKLWDTWLLFLAAVIISTSYGDPWPGLLTTFLTALASAYCFLPPSIKATSVDLTERKQAEEALRESEERLQAILDNSPAVVYLKDTQGRYILVNRQTENMVRLTKEQIIGKTDYDMYPKEIADAFRANDQRAEVQ